MANQLNLGGQSLNDYRAMFSLTDEDLQKSILDYAAGPTTFNLELIQQQGSIVSGDELYQLSFDALQTIVEENYQAAYAEMQTQAEKMLWKNYASLDELAEQRKQQIDLFLQDYTAGKQAQRYVPLTTSAKLPFADFSFALALSHYHFFRDNQLVDQQRYIDEISELCRVAHEVRIFPLLDRFGEISASVGPVMLGLQQLGCGIEIKEVDFYLHQHGNALLRVWATECHLEPASL